VRAGRPPGRRRRRRAAPGQIPVLGDDRIRASSPRRSRRVTLWPTRIGVMQDEFAPSLDSVPSSTAGGDPGVSDESPGGTPARVPGGRLRGVGFKEDAGRRRAFHRRVAADPTAMGSERPWVALRPAATASPEPRPALSGRGKGVCVISTHRGPVRVERRRAHASFATNGSSIIGTTKTRRPRRGCSGSRPSRPAPAPAARPTLPEEVTKPQQPSPRRADRVGHAATTLLRRRDPAPRCRGPPRSDRC
jgi:hypothetical protein